MAQRCARSAAPNAWCNETTELDREAAAKTAARCGDAQCGERAAILRSDHAVLSAVVAMVAMVVKVAVRIVVAAQRLEPHRKHVVRVVLRPFHEVD